MLNLSANQLTASEPRPPEGPYQQEYRELGQKVYYLTLTYLLDIGENRLNNTKTGRLLIG